MNVSRKLACDRLTRTWHWMYVRLEIHRIQQNEKKAKFEERRSWNTAIRIHELRKSKKNLKKQKEERKMLKDSISTLILDFQSWGRMVAVPAINLWSLYQRQPSTAVRHKPGMIGLTVRVYVCAYLYTMHMYCKPRTITPRWTIIFVSHDDRLLNCDPSSINHITWLPSVRSHGPKYLNT